MSCLVRYILPTLISTPSPESGDVRLSLRVPYPFVRIVDYYLAVSGTASPVAELLSHPYIYGDVIALTGVGQPHVFAELLLCPHIYGDVVILTVLLTHEACLPLSPISPIVFISDFYCMSSID